MSAEITTKQVFAVLNTFNSFVSNHRQGKRKTLVEQNCHHFQNQTIYLSSNLQ